MNVWRAISEGVAKLRHPERNATVANVPIESLIPTEPAWNLAALRHAVNLPRGQNPMPRAKELPKVASTEPIVAYRVWGLGDGRLKSCAYDFAWPFRRRLATDLFSSLGIHAVKDVHQLAAVDRSLTGPCVEWRKGLWYDYVADVAGSVYLWGNVREYEFGYTAQYAYPKELFMPEDTDPLIVMQLEENYGVPVTLRKEFVKRIIYFPSVEEGWGTYKVQYTSSTSAGV